MSPLYQCPRCLGSDGFLGRRNKSMIVPVHNDKGWGATGFSGDVQVPICRHCGEEMNVFYSEEDRRLQKKALINSGKKVVKYTALASGGALLAGILLLLILVGIVSALTK